MKKIYLLGLSLITLGAFAQQKGQKVYSVENSVKIEKKVTKAVGDTVFFFDSRFVQFANTADQNDFALNMEDIDQQAPSTTYSNAGFTSEWMLFYSLDQNDKLPGDVDSAFFWGATSWFATPSQADNWFSFGPITVPTTGGELSWYEKFNPQWTDSYEVFIITSVADMATGPQAYMDVDPNADTPIYTKAQISGDPNQPATDTIFTQVSYPLGQYAGQRIWVVFHHNANDGDMLFIDHFLVTEQNNASVQELTNNKTFSIYPNPAQKELNINTLKTQDFSIIDVTGKVVMNISAKNSTIKVDLSELSSGVYFVKGQNGQIEKLVIK